MNEDDAHVLRALAQLARGTEIELPLIGEHDSSQPDAQPQPVGQGMFATGNVTITRSFHVDVGSDTPSPGRSHEVAHTLVIQAEIPCLLLELEMWKHAKKIAGALVALRALGLVYAKHMDFWLPPGTCVFRTSEGTSMQLTATASINKTRWLGMQDIYVESESGRFARTTGSRMEWYGLTQDGWKAEGELAARAESERANKVGKKTPKAKTRQRKRRPRDTPTPRQAEAYLLHLKGLSHAKIGDQLGISAAAAGKLVKRAVEIVDRSKGRSVRAKQAIPKDPRGQELVSGD